jgi:uncharacterized protein
MAMEERRLRVDVGDGSVSAAWVDHSGASAAMVLGHGAGSGMDSPFVAGFAQAAALLGLATLRFMFPYMERGRRAPDRPPLLLATVQAAFEATGSLAGDRPVLAGGKSLGGRIASMAAAEGLAAAGLIFLGYPLHPPGKPERLRDAHLDAVRVPMLFLQGTRDPFATPELLEAVVARLGGRAELRWIEGGDHSFKTPGRRIDAGQVGAGLAEPAADFARRMAAAGR